MALPDVHVQEDVPVTSGKESSPTIINYVCPKLCWKKAGREEGNTDEKRETKKKTENI